MNGDDGPSGDPRRGEADQHAPPGSRSRLEFLERRVTAGFEKLTGEIDDGWRRQMESETRLATEVVSLASVTHQVKDLPVDTNIAELKARVASLEKQLSRRDG